VHRPRAWIAVSPVVLAGVFVAHSLAYRLTGTHSAPLHSYLAHAPQVLVVLAVAGLVTAGVGARLDAPPARAFPLAALATFVVQEHVERLVHGGEPLSLFVSPAFIVGLALQLPVALVAWALARWLLGAVRAPRTVRLTRRPQYVDGLVAPRRRVVALGQVRIPPGRGPPRLLPSS
jgi:hypothetical protein